MARVRKSKGFLRLGRGENKRELRGDRREGNEDGGKMDGGDDLDMGLEREWREMPGLSEKGVVVVVVKEQWRAKLSIVWMPRKSTERENSNQTLWHL